MTEYWSEWHDHADKGMVPCGPHHRYFPSHETDEEFLTEVRPELKCEIPVGNGESVWIPDLRKTGILGRRYIVSRKRGRNIFDLTNTWKKVVFRQMDENIAEEGGVVPTIPPVDLGSHLLDASKSLAESIELSDDESDIVLHRRSASPDQEHPMLGRGSKRGTA